MLYRYETLETVSHPTSQEVTLNLFDEKTLIGKYTWFFYPKATDAKIQAQADKMGKQLVDTRAEVAKIPVDADIHLTTPDIVPWTAKVLKRKDELGNCEVYIALYQGGNFQTALDIVPRSPDEVKDFAAKMSQVATDIVLKRDAQKTPPANTAIAEGK